MAYKVSKVLTAVTACGHIREHIVHHSHWHKKLNIRKPVSCTEYLLHNCLSNVHHLSTFLHFLLNRWISETFASFAIPGTEEWRQICLRKSQFINSIASFLPSTVLQQCHVRYLDVSDPRFRIETRGGDLVSSADQCIVEPLWKVSNITREYLLEGGCNIFTKRTCVSDCSVFMLFIDQNKIYSLGFDVILTMQ